MNMDDINRKLNSDKRVKHGTFTVRDDNGNIMDSVDADRRSKYGYNEYAILLSNRYKRKPRDDARLDKQSLKVVNGVTVSDTTSVVPSSEYVVTTEKNATKNITGIIHVVVSKCPNCGADLPIRDVNNAGICTCEFCNKDVYVWAKGE